VGFDNRDISIALSTGKRTIDKWVHRFQNTVEMQEIKHMGCQRTAIIKQNLDIALCATERSTIISAEIKQELGLDISLVTIGKRFHESKLFSRVARQKEHSSVGRKAQRLQFTQNFQNFDNWDKTVCRRKYFYDRTCCQNTSPTPYRNSFRRRFHCRKSTIRKTFCSCFLDLMLWRYRSINENLGSFRRRKIYRNIK
jgi:transposase